MNILFWNQVRTNWQSVQTELLETNVDLELFRRILLNDINSIKEIEKHGEHETESEVEEDFWGGL